jgi:multidrug efflux pump subunit AcrA (membrane-fusion protein)
MKLAAKIVILLAVLGAIGWGGFYLYQRVQQRRQLGAAKVEEGPLKVAVARVSDASLERRTFVTGEVKATQVVEVVPKVLGCLQRLRLPDGTPLEVGTVIQPDPATKDLPVIAVIEHAALAAAVQQAEAGLRVAEAAIATAKGAVGSAQAAAQAADVTLADCKREKTRMENLLKEGSGTPKQLDAATATYDRAAAQCDQVRADLTAAQARVAQAQAGRAEAAAALRRGQVALDDATLRAPIAGVVTRKYVDEGNMVGPTTPLVRLAQIETVKVIGGVGERHIRSVVPGKTHAAIAVDAFPGESFAGTVHLVGEAADAATRTIDVEIRVPNPARKLKPGMFARVTLVLERRAGVPVVPDSALLRDDEGPYVFVVNDEKARRQRVSLGLAEGAVHEVTAGLKGGDVVVVRGQRQLRDGQAVRTVQEKQK